MKNEIEILIPTYNEEGNIKNTIIELKKNGFKNITILDAQSEDDTVLIAKKYNCKIIVDKKKKIGFGHSLINGFKSSKKKYCCIFDGDGSFNPKAINEMIIKIKKGNDFIFGSRYLGGNNSDDDTIITKIGNFFFTQLISLLFNFKTTDALFLYTLAETKKFKSLKLKEQDFRICTEILIKANNIFKCKEVFSKERRRKYGVSKVNKIQDGIKLLLNILNNYLNTKS
tara:strand:+ start:273 stop:953 length:681 start_codon:yes stop_codon:yes gene_type:complete